jgi:hypothetical protein
VNPDKITLDQHPRAQASIARLKGIGGIACFAIVGLLSLRAGVPFFDSGLRALVAGVAGYSVTWFCAVQVWRHVAVAEIRRHQMEALRRRQQAMEEIEAAREAGSGQPA